MRDAEKGSTHGQGLKLIGVGGLGVAGTVAGVTGAVTIGNGINGENNGLSAGSLSPLDVVLDAGVIDSGVKLFWSQYASFISIDV